MTDDQFLTECKFVANQVMKYKHDNLDLCIDQALRILKDKRAKQMPKDNPLNPKIFDHYAKQYKPLVRWMVIALNNKEDFK
jgi:hypothetical protein